ncbi:MAG: phosphate transport system permease protein [Frankiales bacterium]|jgi:phosphate transport system permease protein|nr:phosphate transport system permease protein [Frankiales bacterium]MDX6212224.1 phosphate transport system permease protein [Frankiales bacterium]
MTLLTEAADPAAPQLVGRRGRGDTLSRLVTSAAGIFVLVLLAAIAVFLVVKAIPAISKDSTSFWGTKLWQPDAATPTFGIAAIAFGTLETAVIALVIAWPVAMAVALFVAEYAPRRLAKLMGYLLDLLAAVPSVVYGLWGLVWLVPRMAGLQGWLGHHLSWIPLFKDRYAGLPTRSPFVVGVVLAIMILPIISAIIREIVVQADPQQKEAALALGATHWEMIRMAVLPPSKSGIIGATILGLGRALGETIAVALILASSFVINWHILEQGGNTIAANIAVQFGEANATGRSALIASGLVLFGITLLVNLAARLVISRGNKGKIV